MSFPIIIILIIIIIVVISIMVLIAKSIGVWRFVKASKVEMLFVEFLFHYQIMLVKKIPADLVFKLLINAKKGDAVISISVLKEFYKIINDTVTRSVKNLNKNLHEGELQLKRISSYYVLSGNIDDLLYLLIDSIEAEEDISIKTYETKTSDIKLLELANKLLRSSAISLAKAYKKTSTTKTTSKKTELTKEEKEKKEKNISSLLYFYGADILSFLKGERIFMSKNENLNPLNLNLFEISTNALIKAQQAGLPIKLEELKVYLGMNGDIEKTINLLIKAKQAGFTITLDNLEKLIVIGADVEDILENIIKAKKAGVINIELTDLEKYHILGGNITQIIMALIRLHEEGLDDISIDKLYEFASQGKLVDDIVNALIKLKQENITEMEFKDLIEFHASGEDIEELVLGIVKLKQSGIKIEKARLKSFKAQGGNIHTLIRLSLKSNNYNLDLNITDFENFNRTGADLDDVFSAFRLAKNEEDITKKEMIELQIAGGDMFTYVRAYGISQKNKLEIKKEQIEAYVIEGRDVLQVIFAMIYAKKINDKNKENNKNNKNNKDYKNIEIKLEFERGIRLDREGYKVYEIVNWAVNPQIIDIKPIKIISQDGVTIELSINVTVRGIIEQYLKGSREDVLNDRVNEIATKEIDRFESYKDVLEALNKISNKIYRRLTGTMNKDLFPYYAQYEIDEMNKIENELNLGSAYEIFDVNISNIGLGEDAFSDIRKERAELEKIIAKTNAEKIKAIAIAKEYEAKTKLIEAEAELHRGFRMIVKASLC